MGAQRRPRQGYCYDSNRMNQLLKFKNSSNQKGFTLIELIIVLTLIGILAPGMALIFSNILDNYRTMTAIGSVTKRAEFALSRFTEDMNNCTTITRAGVEEIEIEIATVPAQTYRYKIDGTDATIKLCLADCGNNQNFHTVIEGVRPTTEFKYLNEDRAELADNPPKPWLSTEAGNHDRLNEIIYVELKLDLVFLDGTTSYSTIVFPERKVTL